MAATKKNDQQSKLKLLKKYGVLQVKYNNDGIIYTINPSNLDRGGKELMGYRLPYTILKCGSSTKILIVLSPGSSPRISSTSSRTPLKMMICS